MIGIGTVQFGMDYGIANHEGMTSPEEVAKILDIAASSGVRIIDTASSYGESEQVLGLLLTTGHDFNIVTKTPGFGKNAITGDDARILEETFYRSLERLRQPNLYGLMVHNCDDLLAENGFLLMEKMIELKSLGCVNKIGVSIYNGLQIDRIMARYNVDIIQLPVSVLDQRLIASGHLAKLKEAGVEIHARSVFLQGLLLMSPDNLPPHFDRVRGHLKRYHRGIRQLGLTTVEAALGFIQGLPEVDAIICGINNHRHLQEICSFSGFRYPNSLFAGFAMNEVSVLNPSLWQI
ncbi:MAG: aldo/keto reductase [Bacillota bacterium]